MHDSLRPCRINKNRLFPLWGLIRKLPSFDVHWLTYLTRWVWGRTLSLFCHAARFQAVTVASLNELKPKSVLSFSAVLRQVSFGLPRLRLPSLSWTSPLSRTQVVFPWICFPVICYQLSRAPVVSNRFWVCVLTVVVQNVISDDCGTN